MRFSVLMLKDVAKSFTLWHMRVFLSESTNSNTGGKVYLWFHDAVLFFPRIFSFEFDSWGNEIFPHQAKFMFQLFCPPPPPFFNKIYEGLVSSGLIIFQARCFHVMPLTSLIAVIQSPCLIWIAAENFVRWNILYTENLFFFNGIWNFPC